MSTTPDALRTWRLDLPMRVPLSLNARQHWRVKARQVRDVRHTAATLARAAAIPPLGRCEIELHYAPRDSRRRDAINLVATLKPIEDGIVDAGVVPDDIERYVRPTVPVLDPPARGAGQLYVLVRELEPVDR